VYEEKNMESDEFATALVQKFDQKFFKHHPYGQKDRIGTVEELKNPSLTRMYAFFKDWYVANNMALVVSGNFDAEAVKPMIREKFGRLKRGTLPERTVYAEQPFKGREFHEDTLSPIEIGLLGFRTVPAGHPDELPLTVCDRMLSNANQTGLLDRLALDGELLAVDVMPQPLQDHGSTTFLFLPNMPEQKLDDAEQLVMAAIAGLKKGEFEDWMLAAIKNEVYVEHQMSLESPADKALSIAEYFAEGRDVQDLMKYADRIRNITKKQVLEVAQKYYGEKYLAFYSKTGSPEKDTIDKPGYEPLIANTSARSPFRDRFERMKALDVGIDFVDFDKDVQYGKVQDKVALYTTRNPVNDIFTLTVRYGVGEHAMPMLEYATQIMNYSGAGDKEVADFKKEFSTIGCSYEILSSESYTYIAVQGLEENFEKAMQLTGALLAAPNVDPEKLDIIVQEVEAVREIERSEPDTVAEALFEYVRYKEKSSFLDRLTLEEIKALDTDVLVADFKKAMSFETEMHYVGTMERDKVAAIVKETLKFPEKLIATESPVILDPAGYDENTVYFVNKEEATQSKIFLYTRGMKHDRARVPQIEAFNMYFGGGFSGLVLQEIREYRSLAYAAGAFYSTPPKEGAETQFYGYVGTQADKTLEALEVFYGLIRGMPHKKDQMENIRTYLVQSALTATPSFRDLSAIISDWKTEGYSDDPRKKQVPVYATMSFKDIVRFYRDNIKEKPIVCSFAGDKKRIDMKGLQKYGTIVEVEEKSLFN
jgi:predicted Zn-dependent peptidase